MPKRHTPLKLPRNLVSTCRARRAKQRVARIRSVGRIGAEGVIRHLNQSNNSNCRAILSHMPNYRRASVSGGCFFFTVNLLERRQTLLVDQIALLREAVTTTRRSHPFTIDAFVVLPDHLHAIWTLPADDCDFSMRWRLIKSRFARALPSCKGASKTGAAQRCSDRAR